MPFTTSRYIPKGATKVADRQSDAIVYVYSERGRHYAIGYCGKRLRSDFNSWFKTEAFRERYVRDYFEARRQRLTARAEKPVAESKLYVGAVLKTCWGYDQTNVEFFQVTALIGKRMVEVREIKQAVVDTAWCQHSCSPVHDEFVGEPLRRKIGRDGETVRIDNVRYAWPWNGKNAQATSYA